MANKDYDAAVERPFTEEERAYYESRGQGYLVQQNERIYGRYDADKAPEEPGRNPDSENAKSLVEAQRKSDAEAKKSVAGTPTPVVDPRLQQQTGDQLDANENLDDADPGDPNDEGEIDDDISEFADSFTIAELKGKLDEEEVEYPEKAKHAEYAELYANVLQDKRDAGEELDLTKDE